MRSHLYRLLKWPEIKQAAEEKAVIVTFLVMGLTTVLWVSVALLTPPDLLESFYRRACPMGAWEPVRNKVVGTDVHVMRQWGLIGCGFLVAILGAVSVMLYIIGISNLFVAKWSLASASLVGAILLMTIFVRRLPRYLDRLEEPLPLS